MTEMPTLIVQVLSPSQAAQDILSKFRIYFDAGVKSCWLVVPITTSIIVYTAINRAQIFKSGVALDPIIGTGIALDDIFGQ